MSSPFKNPELMVIGDSLAQGCRSLSVTGTFCEQSYSAVIARERGWEFHSPSFPRPVLFDLEEIVRRDVSPLGALLIARLFSRLQKNFDDWCADFTSPPASSGQEWNDNLAVAGARIQDLDIFHWQRSRDLVAAAAGKKLIDLVRASDDALSDLHLAINSGYVLNPRRLKKYAGWNALRWVAERRPKNLIIHMGHNNGLYPIGAGGEESDIEATTAPLYEAVIDDIEQATTTSQLLIFILLPKISSVANLAVSGDGPDTHGYWERYRPVFSTSSLSLSRSAMKRMDDGIKAANIRIRTRLEALQSKRNVRVIDAYDILESKDFKNSRDPKRQIVIGKTTVDNRYLTGESHQVHSAGGHPGHGAAPPIRWRFDHGGFQSIDGMHPSAVGYAEVAIEIMKALNFGFNKPGIRATALRNETLIGRYPVGHRALLSVLDIVRHLPKNAGGSRLPADGKPENETGRAIEAIQRCTITG